MWIRIFDFNFAFFFLPAVAAKQTILWRYLTIIIQEACKKTFNKHFCKGFCTLLKCYFTFILQFLFGRHCCQQYDVFFFFFLKGVINGVSKSVHLHYLVVISRITFAIIFVILHTLIWNLRKQKNTLWRMQYFSVKKKK